MKTFFDSSAFAKRYIDEVGSDRVEHFCAEASTLGLSVLCVPEIISALNRRLREGALTSAQYRMAKERLSEEVADAEVINLVPDVIAEAVHVLETNPLRAMDALHVACATRWGAERFVSADKRQLEAASQSGLRIESA